MTITFFFSNTGSEMLWAGEGWKKILLGYHAAALFNPIFKEVMEYEDEARMDKLRQLVEPIFPTGERPKYLQFFDLWTALTASSLSDYEGLTPSKQFIQFEDGYKSRFKEYSERIWVDHSVNFIPFALKNRVGFLCTAPDLLSAAYIEAFLMVVFNIRRILFCPECLQIHWNQKEKQKDRQIKRLCDRCKKKRRNSKPKSSKDLFLNMISRAKGRGKLTEEQAELLRRLWRDRGETFARSKYKELTGGGKRRSSPCQIN
jgi:hypothetical protein